MTSSLFRRAASLGLWGGVSGLFSLFVASGNLIFSMAILCAALLFSAMLLGSQLIAYIWLVGQPTVFVFFNQFLKALPFVTMERVMIVILLGMMIIGGLFAKKKQPSWIRLEFLIIAFISYAAVSLAINTNSLRLRQDLWFLLQYAIPMTMFIISRRIRWREQGVRVLFASLTVAGALLGIIGVLQVFFGIDMFTVDYQSVTSGHKNRAHGTFTNADTYSATLVVFFVLTLLQYGMYRDSLIRFALVAAMFLMAVGIVLGQTRGPWVGFACAIFIVFLRDRNVRTVLVVGGSIALAGGLVALLLTTDQLSFLENRFSDTSTISGRLAVWATAINTIAHNPVFGVGFGSDSFLLNKYDYLSGIGTLSAQYAVYLRVPHNEYLHVSVLLGLVGLFLFLGILYGSVQLMFRIHLDTKNSCMRRKIGAYIGAIVIGLCVNGLFVDTFLQDYFWMLAFFLAGLVAGMSQSFGAAKAVSHAGKEP